MKKIRKINLALDKELISSLSNNEMGNVKGGTQLYPPPDKSLGCPQSGYCVPTPVTMGQSNCLYLTCGNNCEPISGKPQSCPCAIRETVIC